jgi:hypothetical protein
MRRCDSLRFEGVSEKNFRENFLPDQRTTYTYQTVCPYEMKIYNVLSLARFFFPEAYHPLAPNKRSLFHGAPFSRAHRSTSR